MPHGGRYSVRNRDPRIVDFSSSVSPAGAPPAAMRALREGLGRVADYPDPDSSDLVSGLARYTGLPRSRLVVGNGAVEIIYGFCAAFLAGRRALIQAPTFGEYEAACRLAGCRTEFFGSEDLSRDLRRFVGRIPRGGCVFVCNPNNPTGAMLSRREVSRVIAAAGRRSSFAFVDECFIELSAAPGESVLGLVRRRDNLLVLRSLTKSFGLAGIRVGYAAAPGGVASALRGAKVPWSVNALAQRAGLAAIRSGSHLAKARGVVAREAAFLARRIGGIPGFECRETSANFILVRTARDSTLLQGRLLGRGVLVRDCAGFRGLDNHHIRVAVRSRRDNLRLVRALEAA